MKNKKGLFHINRRRFVTPESIEESVIFQQLHKRTHHKTWMAAIRIADDAIDSLDGRNINWAKLASLFGHKGSASIKDGELLWRMVDKAAKSHDVLLKKMFGVFLMWRFAHRDDWYAYVDETGNYDEISEKEITVTCYFKKT